MVSFAVNESLDVTISAVTPSAPLVVFTVGAVKVGVVTVVVVVVVVDVGAVVVDELVPAEDDVVATVEVDELVPLLLLNGFASDVVADTDSPGIAASNTALIRTDKTFLFIIQISFSFPTCRTPTAFLKDIP